MTLKVPPQGTRVLICAPFGSDAQTAAGLLSEHAVDVSVCVDLQDVTNHPNDDIGVILLTDEAIAHRLDLLRTKLGQQHPWSDIPLIVLAARSTKQFTTSNEIRERLLELTANAVVLERPLSVTSLVSATRSALRARKRQFDLRDRIAELDTQYNRVNTLLAHLPVGVAFFGSNRSTLVANPAYLRFRPEGVDPAVDPRNEACWETYDSEGSLVSPDQFAVARALRGESVTEAEYLYRPENGVPVWTRVNAIPLRDASAGITGAVTVIVDIDDMKRAQASLAQSAADLEEQVQARTAQLEQTLNKLKSEQAEREKVEDTLRQSQKMEAVGQLTGGIAHDFNNMLTGVIGSLDILRRRLASGRMEGLDRFMDAASTSAARAAALTQRLLAFSRRQPLDAKPVPVNELVLSMKDLFDRAIDERVELDIILAPSLPNAIVDYHQLENAILNLVINARDAMPAGGVLTVATQLVDVTGDEAILLGLKPGEYIVAAVSDTGVGMSQDMLEKVFEPFFTTKPLGQGTGLGLSMVYGFAQQSGGQVRIESQLNVGTRVQIYLPTTEATTLVAEASQTDAARGTGERVLVVEDEESVLALIREVLTELGYQTIETRDPLRALPLLASDERIDLMISDVGMPGMNGRQLADIARQHRSQLPILFITGYAENAAMRAGFLGAKMAMLAKPFSLEILSARVKQMITSPIEH